MRKLFFAISAAIAAIITSSCAALQLGIAATGIAFNTASLVGNSIIMGHDLHTFVGSHKTVYEFELLGVVNDADIQGGKILSSKADAESKALYQDDAIGLTFCYRRNCFVIGLKTMDRLHSTVQWSDFVLEKDTQLQGKSGATTLNHSSFSEGKLYVVYDNISRTPRTLPLYISQKKADKDGIVGAEFPITFPLIRGNEVVTYSLTVRITSVSVD